MTAHAHARLRGHIAPALFDPQQRQAWYRTRYLEALQAHHRHSTDRAALLRVMGVLFDALQAGEGEWSVAQTSKTILDIACGNGELSARLLGLLAGRTAVDYLGIDINADLLPEARPRLAAALGQSGSVQLRCQDYADFQRGAGLPETRFDFVWLIHGGYYLSQGHAAFVDALERQLAASGLLVLIHNPEGHAPFRAAAQALELSCDAFPYRREIVPPVVPPEVFAALASDPGDLDAFSRRFAGLPEAHTLRLLLEFYLPDYPLEALPPDARAIYVNRWQQHLATEGGRFANRHEMLLIWPRSHPQRMRAQCLAYLHGVLTDE